ncbi:hypothetical protein IKC_04227 [Bacillus cereus VD184]|uniref:Uncharacterized protein n=2 Tax=Bacillus cereus TaxID=1396 RepID=A0A9W5RBP5_BACCE|nr:putative membrane protein [Bacillus cereus 03BB108]EOQ19753.1 hypothetical protein IKC_04227 [Bacillus cereus VD184]
MKETAEFIGVIICLWFIITVFGFLLFNTNLEE